MKTKFYEHLLSLEAAKYSELLGHIELKRKSLEPFINYYTGLLIQSEITHEKVGSFHDKSLNHDEIFNNAIKALDHPEVTGRVIENIYHQIRLFLDQRYSPSLLLKATVLMHRDMKGLLAQLKKDKRALQDYVLKRQYDLFLAILYLELFGSRNTVHLLESFFEMNQEHPYIQSTDSEFSQDNFTLFVTKMYNLLKDYGSLSDAMNYHFKPLIYNENVLALKGESISVGDYHRSITIANGHEVTPGDYYLPKEGPFLNRNYIYECVDSIKYMPKNYVEIDTFYIVSPMIKALLTFEAKGQNDALNHKRTTFEVIECEDHPKGLLILANYYQLGDTYFAQRSTLDGGCRYCDYMYPLTHYATLHIKDLNHPTDEEIEVLHTKTKHIFNHGGI